MASSGLHANGFSLVRAVVDAPESGLDLHRQPDELSQPLGQELLTPTRIYAKDCLALADSCAIRAFAHVTGGGLAANLSRVLPPDADAVLDRGSWRPLPIFSVLAARGNIAADEMERVFNMGVGMVAIVARDNCDHALQLCAERGLPAWLAGEIAPGSGHARLTGTHPV
jgi:phosphoribosylformylglycinamidine cyclo-ligase